MYLNSQAGTACSDYSTMDLLQIEDNLASLKFLDKLTPEVFKKIDEIFPAPAPAKTYFTLEGFQNIDQPIH